MSKKKSKKTTLDPSDLVFLIDTLDAMYNQHEYREELFEIDIWRDKEGTLHIESFAVEVIDE